MKNMLLLSVVMVRNTGVYALFRNFNNISIGVEYHTFVVTISGLAWFGGYGVAISTQNFSKFIYSLPRPNRKS